MTAIRVIIYGLEADHGGIVCQVLVLVCISITELEASAVRLRIPQGFDKLDGIMLLYVKLLQSPAGLAMRARRMRLVRDNAARDCSSSLWPSHGATVFFGRSEETLVRRLLLHTMPYCSDCVRCVCSDTVRIRGCQMLKHSSSFPWSLCLENPRC